MDTYIDNMYISNVFGPQEHGSGAADASQSEGHDSKLMARMNSQKQTQKNTQVSRLEGPLGMKILHSFIQSLLCCAILKRPHLN